MSVISGILITVASYPKQQTPDGVFCKHLYFGTTNTSRARTFLWNIKRIYSGLRGYHLSGDLAPVAKDNTQKKETAFYILSIPLYLLSVPTKEY